MRISDWSSDVCSSDLTERLPGPIRSLQVFKCSPGSRRDRPGGNLGQRGVGIAEAVDRLLRISYPHAAGRNRCQRRKDRDLDRTRVLEFIDVDAADHLAQACSVRWITKNIERDYLLIDEIDDATRCLVGLVCSQTGFRAFELKPD